MNDGINRHEPELNEQALEGVSGGTSSESYAKHAKYLCGTCPYKYRSSARDRRQRWPNT